MELSESLKNLIRVSADDAKSNARIRYIPNASGKYKAYEALVFPKNTFVRPGFECSGGNKKRVSKILDIYELCAEVEESSPRADENKRKSYQRARNNLFNLLMCTLEFDAFVTLTLDASKVNRYDYGEVVKKLSQWLDNRVRRNNLVYALVPELHKDGAIHFHGLMNTSALKLVRGKNAHNGKELFDNSGRPIFNIADFPLGINSVIPLSGDNAREAAAKYCYKYITKSGGEKVGGRYYLSGGKLGRPRYEYVNLDYDAIDAPCMKIAGVVEFKKVRVGVETHTSPKKAVSASKRGRGAKGSEKRV